VAPADQTPCAFLRDHLCAIYAFRPATCRKAHSLSVEACASGAAEIPQDLSLLLNCETLVAGTKGAFRMRNLPVTTLELSAAVLAALSSSDAAERWYQGQPLLGDKTQQSADADGSSV
jgi:hypothetical protein